MITDYYRKFYEKRNTQYNSIVALNHISVDEMLNNFDGIFDGWVNFTEEIASFTLYPFDIPIIKTPPYDGQYMLDRLQTTRGTPSDVEAFKVDISKNYFYMGQYENRRRFNNFFDFKGYTYIKAYLPLVGLVDIDVNETIDKVIQFRLLVDYYTGKGMYIIGVSDSQINQTSKYADISLDTSIRVIATFECDIGVEIPLGKSNIGNIKRNMLLGAVKTAASIATGVYLGGLPSSVSSTSSTKTTEVMSRGQEKGSRMKPMGKTTTQETYSRTINRPYDKVRPISEAIENSIDCLHNINIQGATDRVNDSALAYINSNEIVLYIYTPKTPSMSGEYKNLYGHLYGFPYGDFARIGDLTGYTEISNMHYDNIYGENGIVPTSEELTILQDVLSSGILL